jgi:hypothetical protein
MRRGQEARARAPVRPPATRPGDGAPGGKEVELVAKGKSMRKETKKPKKTKS